MGRSEAKAVCDDLSSSEEDPHAIVAEAREFLARLHPVGRTAEAADTVDAILFLESAHLSMGEILRAARCPASRFQNGVTGLGRHSAVSNDQDKASRRHAMPIVNIQITREGTLPGQASVTREQKAQLSEGASKLLLDVLNKPMNSTFVVIDEVDVENWGWGGLAVEECRKRMAASARVPDIKLVGIAKE